MTKSTYQTFAGLPTGNTYGLAPGNQIVVSMGAFSKVLQASETPNPPPNAQDKPAKKFEVNVSQKLDGNFDVTISPIVEYFPGLLKSS